ncbi:hypothetical protein QOT17_004972 [Balamuthia mandrillaris]
MWLFKGKAGPTTEGEGQDVAAKGVHVVAIDESRDAEHAFQWAADNLPKGDRFILVNGVFAFPRQGEAINPLVELFPSTSPKEFEEYTRLQNNYQTKLFDYYREKCNTAKRDCTFLSVKYKGSGDLGERVCNVASEADAKSVVCGSRGLRFIDRFLFFFFLCISRSSFFFLFFYSLVFFCLSFSLLSS